MLSIFGLKQQWLKGALLLILFIPFWASLLSQTKSELNFHSIDNTSGLPNNFINAIEMDSLGFLWFGTNDGLCRYDSPSNIKVFKTGQIGIKSNHIKSLHAGNDSVLWIGTSFGGLTKFNILNNTTKTYNDENGIGALSNNEVISIHEMNNDELWVGTEGGLNVLYPEVDSVFQFPIDAGNKTLIQATAIIGIEQDNLGWQWIGTWAGSMYLYLPSKSGLHHEGIFRQFILDEKVGSRNVWKIFQDSHGRHWIATLGGGLYLMNLPENASNDQTKQDWQPSFYNFTSNPTDPNSITSDYVTDIVEDKNGDLWISTVHGLNILSENEIKEFVESEDKRTSLAKFYSQHYNPTNKNSLLNNNLTKVFIDKQGLIWVGSISGINQYNWYTNQFAIYNIEHEGPSLHDSYELINSIYLLNENTILLGSDLNGILAFDLEKEKLIKNNKYRLPPFQQRATFFHKGNRDDLYIGTHEGIGKIDLVTNSSKMYYYPEQVEGVELDVYTTCIFKDSKGRLWGGTESGLMIIDEENDSIGWFLSDHANERTISDNSITKVFEDSQENLWVTTFNGLNRLVDNDTLLYFDSFKRDYPEIGNQIPSNQISAVSEYNNKIYFGSRSGLFYYDLSTEKFEVLDGQRVKYTINSIQISNQGVLWASTSDGLLRFDLNNNESKLYGRNDGIGDMSFRVSSGFKDEHDNFYFGGNKGFIKVSESELKRNEITPVIYITDIKTINSDSEQLLNGINDKTLTLPHNNYYLSLDFAALNYNQPQNNQYAYKLEGFEDDEWHHTQSQQVVYTNLDPGEYTFFVKASNNEGVWNNEGVQLKIHVEHAFVETIWFKLLLGLLAIGLFFFGNSIYTRNIRKRNDILKEYNERLNAQIKETNTAKESLEEREKHMKVLLEKLDHSNQELVRSNKDLEQFAYVASHDMKEPLRTVGTFTNLLNRKFGTQLESSGKEYMEFIVEGVDRMSALINSLLTYSQVGKKDVEFSKNDLNEIVKSKIKDLTKIISDKNAKISCDVLPSVYCSGDQIGMVFYNLILNGLKFNKDDNPTIKISSSEEDNYWKFSVKDNGIGIQKQYESQIFEIFKRLHSREEYEGTGIGLALCNKIVLRHQGKISLETNVDGGTTFYFTIDKNISRTTKPTENVDNSTLGNEVKEILRA